MHRNSMNQDNDRVGSNGYRQMNRGFDNDQQQRSSRNRDDEAGYGGSQYSGYRGSDDRTQRSYGYDDRGFSGSYERHPHDEHERGRWGQDYSDREGHRYMGGMIDDDDRHRRDDGFERSGYRSHGFYDRNRSGGYEQRSDDRYRMNRDERPRYQDRDDRGRFNDTGEGRSYGRGYTGGYDQGYDRNFEHRDAGRFGGYQGGARNDYPTDDNRRYGSPSYGYGRDDRYGRGGYGRDDRRFDEQRGRGGSMTDRFGHNDNDSDRRWSGGGYEEDRRGRGRGRY